MKAKFTGQNGSMGLKKDESYEVTAVNLGKKYPIVLAINVARTHSDPDTFCPYASLEAMFANWDFK